MTNERPTATGQPTVMVVVNDRGQYSVWATERPVPPGWSAVGAQGSLSDCLAHIEQVWTDVLPRVARRPTRRNAPGGGRAAASALTVGAGRV